MKEKESKEDITSYASKHLGQGGSYAVYTDEFDSSLLVSMPRNLARRDWDISGDEFRGMDVWRCHEATFLTDKGLPVAGTLKIVYPSSSELMVESKSIKLYLNSFDMCKMGDSIEVATKRYVRQITQDLQNLLGVHVYVTFFPEGTQTENITEDYHNLYDIVDVESLVIDDYKSERNHLESIELPEAEQGREYVVKVYTNVLRSRCRHTKQKDTGTAYIHIVCSKKTVTLDGLLKQIISLREQNEFHEFCAEKLLCDIKKVDGVKEVMVMLLYARRGSLDINPVRSTAPYLIPESLVNPHVLTEKTQGQ